MARERKVTKKMREREVKKNRARRVAFKPRKR